MNIQSLAYPAQVSSRLLAFLSLLVFALVISGCANNQPKIQTDYDHDVNFSSFKTFGFIQPLGTDETEYTTLVSAYFKQAATAEMEALGYQYTDESPELLVNFFSNTESRSNVSTMPGTSSPYNYYGGWYFGFPIHQTTETRTRHYKMGSLKIDVIHAVEKKLIWQGSTENKINQQTKNNPEAAIHAVVGLIFQQFPSTDYSHATTTP